MHDVVEVSKGTTKQDELFEYVGAPDYLKGKVKNIDNFKNNKDNFEINL